MRRVEPEARGLADRWKLGSGRTRGPARASPCKDAGEALGEPEDATREADRARRDFGAALDADALRGVRIGVMRFAAGLQLAVSTSPATYQPAAAGTFGVLGARY